METFKLPKDFVFGTATASLQIEGGDKNNNWYRFCEEKRTSDGTHCFVADDHWNRYEEDILLMKQLNQDGYRMSLEWSRIEPIPGVFDEHALQHYHKEITMLVDNGIKPIVTLHHFSNPLWFEDQGGWGNSNSVQLFLNYTKHAVEYLGAIVSEWVTINEPNVYVEGTYSSLEFPGAKNSLSLYFKASKNMILAHINAYKLIHKIRREANFKGTTLVGVANHLRVFDASENGVMAKLPKKLLEHSFHDLFLEGMIYGKLLFPLGFGGHVAEKGVYCDFLGINYYTRDMVGFSFQPARVFASLKYKDGSSTNDMGWEIYPQGLYILCKRYWGKYKLPIFITENGLCDETDKKRTRFIYEHLSVVSAMINEGIQVKRYYHWSLLDNFEWAQGLTPKFGLIEVDYDTQKRTIRRSGHFYAEIAREKGVTQQMLDKYLMDLQED